MKKKTLWDVNLEFSEKIYSSLFIAIMTFFSKLQETKPELWDKKLQLLILYIIMWLP